MGSLTVWSTCKVEIQLTWMKIFIITKRTSLLQAIQRVGPML